MENDIATLHDVRCLALYFAGFSVKDDPTYFVGVENTISSIEAFLKKPLDLDNWKTLYVDSYHRDLNVGGHPGFLPKRMARKLLQERYAENVKFHPEKGFSCKSYNPGEAYQGRYLPMKFDHVGIFHHNVSVEHLRSAEGLPVTCDYFYVRLTDKAFLEGRVPIPTEQVMLSLVQHDDPTRMLSYLEYPLKAQQYLLTCARQGVDIGMPHPVFADFGQSKNYLQFMMDVQSEFGWNITQQTEPPADIEVGLNQ